MAANPRTEGLGAQGERDLAPQLSVASPSSESTGDSRHEEIARAAYFLAQARGFEPGHELDNRLASEQRVHSH